MCTLDLALIALGGIFNCGEKPIGTIPFKIEKLESVFMKSAGTTALPQDKSFKEQVDYALLNIFLKNFV